MTERYIIVDGSSSGHCCYEVSIQDTSRPIMVGDKHYASLPPPSLSMPAGSPESLARDRILQYETVCECANESDAKLIVAALNGMKKAEPGTFVDVTV